LQTLEISNWAELLQEVYRDTWDPVIRRYRSSWVFRGAGTRAHPLLSGLARLAPENDDLRPLERHLIRNFRKYASGELPVAGSDWKLLPFAQHHRLPTRLLDWSFSPLIAFHFATVDAEDFDREGVVWCFNHQHSNEFLPSPLRQVLRQEGADVFTAEMLESVATRLDEFDRLAEQPFVLLLEPPSLDMRIANQFALFSVISNANIGLQSWLERHPEAAREIVIPAAAKPEIRDKLDQAGITERLIYPGPDGIARWLGRYYRPGRRAG